MSAHIDELNATPTTAGLADLLGAWVVEVRNRQSTGTGIVWGRSGIVVTNAHCVRDNDAAQIVARGATKRGEVLAFARDHDLAAISVPGLSGPPLKLRDPRALRVGELLFAYGHPLGVHDALAMGVLHTVARHRRSGEPRFIVSDIRLAPGNSGGPLVDAEGRLVGINSMIANGLGVAIPATAVASFVDRVRAARAA
ncbi:MAG TPA: serine protease [Gemmatimonadaceae bacterium]|jgi:serine protease Do|nr:serine protease [Gemmatimonadaceae bacterium]